MNDQPAPGFYGKFPELGDFVNRRMPRAFLEPWDDWLQGAVAASREQLGEDWLDLYLTSPVWCFILSGGLCGEYPRCGLLMPSVDRVGRYYPLVIAVALPLDANPFHVAVNGRDWFDAAGAVILSALDESDFRLEDFDQRVSGLDGIQSIAASGAVNAEGGYGSAWRMPLDTGAEVAAALPALMHLLLRQRLGDYSLWWTCGSEHVEQSLLLSSGMPPAQDFAALLSGNWQESGWEECLLTMPAIVPADDPVPGEQVIT